MSPESDETISSWDYGLILVFISLSSFLGTILLGFCCRFIRFHILSNHDNHEPEAADTTVDVEQGGGGIHVLPTVHETQWPIRRPETLVGGDFSEEHDECAICLECFKEKEICWVLFKCRHVFHKSCVDKWLKINWSCPLCRTDSFTIAMET